MATEATCLGAHSPLPLPELWLWLSAGLDSGATEPTSGCELAVDLRVHFLVPHVASDLLGRLADHGDSQHKPLRGARGGNRRDEKVRGKKSHLPLIRAIFISATANNLHCLILSHLAKSVQ